MITQRGIFLHQTGAHRTGSAFQFPHKSGEEEGDNYTDKQIHKRVARRHLVRFSSNRI